MRFYRRCQWLMLLWMAAMVPDSIWFGTRFLKWPWGLAPLFIQMALALLAAVHLSPWLNTRYLRCRRVYRVLNWSPRLRFSHARAWRNWEDEDRLPETIKVTRTVVESRQ